MMTRLLLLSTVAVSLLACGEESSSNPVHADGGSGNTGKAGGPCFPNQTCFDGLHCVAGTCVPAADGAVTGDGPVASGDGPVANPDGPVVSPDGPLISPDGPVVSPDGPVVSPDGPVVSPDGPVVKPDAKPPKPDAKPKPDACVPSCAGKPCGGADGCGGLCAGYCGTNESCVGYQCVCSFVTCGTVCCNKGELCKLGTCVAGPNPSWKVVTSGTTQTLYAVWGTSAKDAWIVGANGTALHYDGAQWKPMITGTMATLRAVWGTGPSDVFAAGDETSGTSSAGILIHFDGKSWSKVQSFTPALHPFSIWGVGGADFRVAGGWVSGWVRHNKAGTWTNETLPPAVGTLGAIFALHGTSGSDIWGVSSRQTVHFDGKSWAGTSLSTGDQLRGVWASGPKDVWAVGGYAHVIYRFDGTSWTLVTSPINHGSSSTGNGYHAIWGAASNDIYAVGSKGGIAHFDGGGWSVSGAGVTTNWLYGIWGSSGVDVWAVGSTGTLLHYGP
jgi:hypothetical protein